MNIQRTTPGWKLALATCAGSLAGSAIAYGWIRFAASTRYPFQLALLPAVVILVATYIWAHRERSDD